MLLFNDLQAHVPQDSGRDLDWRGLCALIPGLAELDNTPQSPIHHMEGSVGIHTRMVCEALVDLADYRSADAGRRFVLFYAALLHDLGKPACTVTELGGSITSAGHSRRGALDVRVLLWRAGVPFDLRERICRIIATHQVPFHALQGNRAGHTPEFIVRKLSWEQSIRELAAVAEADMRGRHCVGQDDILVAVDLFRELAKDDGCFDAPRSFPDAATRMAYFRGEGSIAADYPFFAEPGSRVTVLSGLPASGKDTWVRKHRAGRPVLSFDDARTELNVKHGTNAAGGAVHLVVDRAKEFLRRKEPFIWNATHLSRQMRQKTLDLLYNYGAEVELVYLEAPPDEINRRNSARDTTLTNAAINKMLFHWEVPVGSEAHQLVLPDSVA